STAAAANTMVTSFADHGCTPDYPKSGHFTCSRERTDHVLPTSAHMGLDKNPGEPYKAGTNLAVLTGSSQQGGPGNGTTRLEEPDVHPRARDDYDVRLSPAPG